MAAYITPPLGSYGTYVLDEPFSSLLVPMVAYECISLRSIDEIIKHGIDPFALHYKPYGQTQEKYLADKANAVIIVTLRSSTGNYINVPNSYIKSYPLAGGIPYQVTGLVLDLGAIPTNMDLSPLMTKLADVTQGVIGIKPKPFPFVLSDKSLVDKNTDTANKAARAALITEVETDHSARLRLQNTVAAQADKIRELEAYAIDAARRMKEMKDIITALENG